MKQFDAVVISVNEIAPGIALLWLAAPPEGAMAGAGQFYMIRCGETYDPLLRRPIAFHRARFTSSPYMSAEDLRRGSDVEGLLPGGGFAPELDLSSLPSPFAAVAILVAKAGRGSGWLATRRPGDVLDILGPLGSGYAVNPSSRNLLLVAGGMGAAPLVALAEEGVARDCSVTLLLGATTAEQVYPALLLPPQVELVVATEDGSAGVKGLVTDLLPEYLGWADQVFTCGPRAMYSAIHSTVSRLVSRKSIQVSVEERMACGLGACLVCSLETRHGMRTACKDGPVFELKEVLL